MDSVGGLLVLLQEETLKEEALKGLYQSVDSNWAEILNSIQPIEELAQSDRSDLNEIASAIVSRCYYHLEEYNYALYYALRSGQYFNIESEQEYEVSIVGKCLEVYILLEKRKKQILINNQLSLVVGAEPAEDSPEEKLNLVPDTTSSDLVELFGESGDGLDFIVNRLLDKCIEKRSYKEAIGIAVEANNVNKLVDILQKCGNRVDEMLQYCLEVALNHVKTKYFRDEVLEALISIYEAQVDDNQNSTYLGLFICLHSLNKVSKFAKVLDTLLKAGSDTENDTKQIYLIAYQAAFDLMDIQDQRFVSELLKQLPVTTNAEGVSVSYTSRLATLRNILGENMGQMMYLDFLFKHNNTDLMLFKKIKRLFSGLRGGNSVLRNAALVCHAFMQSGTTIDKFFKSKEGKEFIRPSNNWARFSAAATYGIIHKGNVKASYKVLKDFLPKGEIGQPSPGGPYAEGGSLYALGLIHACEGVYKTTGRRALNFLYTVLKDSLLARVTNSNVPQSDNNTLEPLQHGACLGIGLVALASGNTVEVNRIDYHDFSNGRDNTTPENLVEKQVLVDILLEVVRADEAISGEAAAYALGMLCLGGGDETHKSLIAQMLLIAQETKHEKIIRALSVAIAFILYNQQEKAEHWISIMLKQKDSLIRYGGMFALGLAYIATSSPSTLKRLLRIAVSDVNNDVRRAAVSCLGFVCLNEPKKIPQLLELLSESYNPFVRYGAAIAVGIGCSGVKDSKESVELIETLLEDKVDFVRQGAMIGGAMLNMQKNTDTKTYRTSKAFKDKVLVNIENEKASTMSRMGAMIAMGILEAGGRNMNIQILGKGGVVKSPSVVGLVMFLQYWYWYPFLHMLSLSFTPTSLIGVNGDLSLIKGFKVECDYKNIVEFDYPQKVKEKKTENRVKIETAVLSMTAKAKARAKKDEKKEGSKMEIEEAEPSITEKVTAEEVFDEAALSEERRAKMLVNPLRVTRDQEKYIVFLANEKDVRFIPVADDSAHKTGIIVLKDLQVNKPLAADAVIRYEIEGKVETSNTREVTQTAPPQVAPSDPLPEIPDSFEFTPKSQTKPK